MVSAILFEHQKAHGDFQIGNVKRKCVKVTQICL